MTRLYFILLTLLSLDTILSLNACQDGRRLQHLPGSGWDTLQNTDKSPIFNLQYNECQKTVHGPVTLPDKISLKTSSDINPHITSTIIKHWDEYRRFFPYIDHILNMTGTLYGYVTKPGSFDADLLFRKKKMIEKYSVIQRTQIEKTGFVLEVPTDTELHPEFRSILNELIRSDFNESQRILSRIIQEYGTHYVTVIHLGGAMIQEDFIDRQFLATNADKLEQMKNIAMDNFCEFFNCTRNVFAMTDLTFRKAYEDSKVSGTTRHTLGANNIPKNLGYSVQLEPIDHLHILYRSGTPLSELVTPDRFPNVPLPILNRVRHRLDAAIFDYFAYNSRNGCTNPDAQNFDYDANFDDGSCPPQMHNYSLGGLYQTCTAIDQRIADICSDLSQKNPLTAAMDCPSGYSSVPLLDGVANRTYSIRRCNNVCTGWFIFRKCREDCSLVPTVVPVRYQSYWCANFDVSPQNSGAMFGGVVSSLELCPVNYVPVLLGLNHSVCISSEYRTATALGRSIPFGGFYSCQENNYLAMNQSQSNGNHSNCPMSYDKVALAFSHENNCNVTYCTKSIYEDPVLQHLP